MSYSSIKTKPQFERMHFKGELSYLALVQAQKACANAARYAASVAKDYGKAILSKGNPTITISEYIKAVEIAQHYDDINQAAIDLVSRIQYEGKL